MGTSKRAMHRIAQTCRQAQLRTTSICGIVNPKSGVRPCLECCAGVGVDTVLDLPSVGQLLQPCHTCAHTNVNAGVHSMAVCHGMEWHGIAGRHRVFGSWLPRPFGRPFEPPCRGEQPCTSEASRRSEPSCRRGLTYGTNCSKNVVIVYHSGHCIPQWSLYTTVVIVYHSGHCIPHLLSHTTVVMTAPMILTACVLSF